MSDQKQRDLPLSFPRRDKSDLVREADLVGGIIREGLQETRRISIGMKGDEVRKSQGGGTYRLPISLDHFRVSTKNRDEAGNFILDEDIHRVIGQKPRSVPITFLYDRPGMNAFPFLGVYAGKTAWCRGDGKTAMRLDKDTMERKPIKCPCELLDDGRCKPHLTLTCRVDGMQVPEVAKFRTTSKRSIQYILSGMKGIMEVTAGAANLPWQQGPLARIPLSLKVSKETVVDREGNTRNVPVVGIAFNGTEDQLEEKARELIAKYKGAAGYLEKLDQQKRLEAAQATKLLLPEDPKTIKDIVEEFVPEAIDEVSDIRKIPTSRDPQAEAKMKEKEKKEIDEVLKEEGFPDAIRKALEGVSDDLIGEGGDLEPAPQATRKQSLPAQAKRAPAAPIQKKQAPPPPPPPPKKPKKPEKFL